MQTPNLHLNLFAPLGVGWREDATAGELLDANMEAIDAAITAGGGGGGAVASVNGHVGIVVLSATDVGADTFGSAATAQSNAEGYTDGKVPHTLAAVTSKWINSYDATTETFTATQPAYTDISGTPVLAAIATSGKWSDLQNATGALTLANGANATTFNQTSAVNWTWANTTVGTVVSTNASPLLNLSANYWATGGATGVDSWSLGIAALTAGLNSPSILTFTHSGSTGVAAVAVPQLNFPDGTSFKSSKRYATYVFSTDGTHVWATSQVAGYSDYSGTDAAVVINNVLTALSGSGAQTTVGGTLYFQNGIYPINSLTQETVTGWTSMYYGIGIPTSEYLYGGMFKFVGESQTVWAGEGANPSGISQVNGVIFNVTAAAMASVGGTAYVSAIFQRPFTTGTFGSDFSDNYDYFENICVRFPVNTRGYEWGFCMYMAGCVEYKNCLADFAVPYNTLSSGSLPAAPSYGFTSSYSSAGAVQQFNGCYASGWQYGYDWQSEHLNSKDCTSIYCTYAAIIGRGNSGSSSLPQGSPVGHPCFIEQFSDQETQNGLVLGGNISNHQRIDIIDYGVELAWSGGVNDQGGSPTFNRVNNIYETNVGYSYGRVAHSISPSQATGVPAIFSHGGSNFTTESFSGTNNFWSQYTTASAAKTRLTSFYGDAGGNLAMLSNNAINNYGWQVDDTAHDGISLGIGTYSGNVGAASASNFLSINGITAGAGNRVLFPLLSIDTEGNGTAITLNQGAALNTNVTDAFPGSALSSNWTVCSGTTPFTVSSGAVSESGTNVGTSYYNAITLGPDQFAQVTVGTPGANGIGPAVRMSPTKTCYIAQVFAATGFALYKWNGSSSTQLGSTYTTILPVTGQLLALYAIGTRIFVTLNGAVIIDQTDSTYTSGQPGLFGYSSTSGTAKNFIAGNANALSFNGDSGISRLGAASLAIGNGTAGDFSGSMKLTGENNQGGYIVHRITKAEGYTATAADYVMSFTATATLVLDSGAAVSGTTYRIKLSASASAGALLTIAPNNSKTIDGAASMVISVLGNAIDVVYDSVTNDWQVF